MIKCSDEIVASYGNVKRVGDATKFTVDNYVGWTIEALQYAVKMDGGKVTFSSEEARESFLNSLLQLTHVENMNKSFQEKQGVLVTRYWTNAGIISNRKEGLFPFKDEEGFRYLNYFGDDVFAQVFDYATCFSEGLARVSKAGQEYFIDTTGQKVFACDPNLNYSFFRDGLARVESKENDQYGYVDKEGQLVIDCIYTDATHFVDGVAIVDKDHHQFIMDKQEKLLTTASLLTSIEDVSKLPKNTLILDNKVVAVLAFENGAVWFNTVEEREDFIKMLDVDQEYTRKRSLN